MEMNENEQNVRLCLITVFFFLFSKTCFWKYKEKTIFLYFLNQKHVWLVEIKRQFFEEKKQKILKYFVTII